jgi:L-fucose mutarotase/ribose pyranase (RbsD/FucU family)
VHTEYDIRKKISSTIKSLMEDDILNILYPYGEDAEIAFIEVNWPSDSSVTIHTTCSNCGDIAEASMSLTPVKNSYNLIASVSCENCGNDALYESNMTMR